MAAPQRSRSNSPATLAIASQHFLSLPLALAFCGRLFICFAFAVAQPVGSLHTVRICLLQFNLRKLIIKIETRDRSRDNRCRS